MSKPYNTKNLEKNVNAVSQEEGGLGEAGLYRHPESGQEMITLSDPLFGEAQSNAAVRLGFVRVRDSRPDEIHNIAMDAITASQGETDSLKGVTARVNALEGVAEKNKDLERQLEEYRKKYESGSPTDSSSVAVSAEAAKQAAVDNVQSRGQGDTSKVEVPSAADAPVNTPVNSDVNATPVDTASQLAPNSPVLGDIEEEKPLAKQNESDLLATAAKEGVDLSEADTVKKKREAIQAHRDVAEKLKEESENE